MVRFPALLLILLPAWAVASPAPDFTRDIQPVLSENCYFCHGPDARNRKADLRLDRREEALRVRDGVAAIRPGDPEGSELYRRLRHHDPDEVMPPPDSNRRVSAQQIEAIRRWIEAGAAWADHWAFVPLVAPPPPEAAGPAPRRNPIDAFVQARLAREGLSPAPEAPREVLFRRASLDLTGLPPSAHRVERFLADPSADAYEKWVDHLLASPAFGERMAWDWLDAARYADTNGYQGDNERSMWPWRDWVVNAFNRNLPHDRFILWQLAGDRLPDATPEQRLATAFLRNHPINGEGGRIAEENRVDYGMDMAETVGTVWLGLTFNCCRCHDHKYDPLAQREYYQLFAFFNRTPVDGAGGNAQTPPVLAVPSAEDEAALAGARAALDAAQAAESAREKELAATRAVWEQQRLAAPSATAWTVLTPASASAEKQTLTIQANGLVLAGGENPAKDGYRLSFNLPGSAPITAFKLEAVRHPSMTHGGLARSDSGNFVLTDLSFTATPPGGGEAAPLKIASAEASYEQSEHKIGKAFDQDLKSGWAVWEGRPIDRDHAAVFRLARPLEAPAGTPLAVALEFRSPHASHNLGHFRLLASTAPDARLDSSDDALLAVLRIPEEKRDDRQKKQALEAHRASDDALAALRREREAAQEKVKAAENRAPKVMVMEDMPEYRKTFMLDRGLYTQPRDEVTAGVPACLPPLPAGAPVDRLALAKWLVSPEQPLTARVVVNRFWQQVFGVGLVKTAENFGVQAEVPPHLDLLNWLAAGFRDGGWDTKALMRTLVTSHTYRQSARLTPDLAARDPDNRLLARGPRFRQPAWMLRDQALAASGLLVDRGGGPGVNAYQPEGVWEEASFGNKKYKLGTGDDLHRRSLYTFWRRILAPTLLFDNAGRQVCEVKANRTNTPLHALTTLNDVTFVEAARALAERALREGGVDDAARIDHACRRLLGRPASSGQQEILVGTLRRLRGEFAADPAAAARLLAIGEAPRDKALDPAEHAAWTAACLALLNLDETLSKE